MANGRVSFEPGTMIFREGDRADGAFLIESGTVEISTGVDAERVVLATLGPGDLFGEIAMLEASTRAGTAIAASPCALMVVDHEQLSERLEQADPVVRALLRGQFQRLRSTLALVRGDVDPHPPLASVAGHPDSLAFGKIRLENELKQALESKALEVRYQPLYDIPAGRITGYEALIRWTHAVRGAISPAEFIALAEETSLINPVGRYVFARVCETLAELRDRGLSELPFVAVNVSGRQLEGDTLLAQLLEAVQLTGVPAGALKIEITESLALDVARVSQLITRAHAAGVRVALDDFGTGYSNLGHLHELRFDTVKLDQGFVRQMLDSPRCLAVVRAIVNMVRALEADMVAEGVETEDQLRALRDMGVRYAQGYLIGKPRERAQMLEEQLRR
jgi:EAL domain-containing protein (putative c-di-GMP-specific phosphodiesterase class I)